MAHQHHLPVVSEKGASIPRIPVTCRALKLCHPVSHHAFIRNVACLPLFCCILYLNTVVTCSVNDRARFKPTCTWPKACVLLGYLTGSKGFPGNSAGRKSTCNAGDPSSIPGSGRSSAEGTGYPFQYLWTSLVAETVKNLPAMQETWVGSLGRGRSPGGGHGDPLQCSCLESPHGQRGLVGYSPWGHKESDMT